jgi:aryl-alcohol dehydrogenase-like predicted oxidoreductase
LLTARYLDADKVGKGDRLFDEGTLAKEVTPAVVAKLQHLATLAREWNIEFSQLALAYTLTIPGMGPVIPASSSVAQLESNERAGKIALSEDQKRRVKQTLEAKE